MNRITAVRTINAPVEQVFTTVSDIRNFSKAVPHIVNVEFLTEQQCGVGTRFRETRLMHGKEHRTELEVTEFVENEKVRMVTDTNGTVWDSLFAVKPSGGLTELMLTMDARPHQLMARLTTMLILGMVTKALEADMDKVKEYCENHPG